MSFATALTDNYVTYHLTCEGPSKPPTRIGLPERVLMLPASASCASKRSLATVWPGGALLCAVWGGARLVIDHATRYCRRGIGMGRWAHSTPGGSHRAIQGTVHISSMLARLLRSSRAPTSLVQGSPGCALRVQETVSKLFYSAQTPQAPESKQESSSEATADPFLAHLQQKTEKELFEILRKQQQQPSTQDDDDETSVSRRSLRNRLSAVLSIKLYSLRRH